MACWAVDADGGSYDVSPRVQVYPGDVIRSELLYVTDVSSPGRKLWRIVMTDETHDTSTQLIDAKQAVDTNADVILFSGVLEGIGDVVEGDDLPGDMMFRDMTYKDEAGNDIPVYLSAIVDDRFGHVAVEYSSGGSPVIIRTNYTA
jgi:hypothetical protein